MKKELMSKIRILLIVLLSVISSALVWGHENFKDLVVEAVHALEDGKPNEAIELLYKAKIVAIEEDNQAYMFLVLNNIGNSYFYLLDYGEALSAYLEAYDIATATGDVKKEMTVLNNISVTLLEDKKDEKAFEYLMKAYNIAKKSGLKRQIGLYALNIGVYYNASEQWIKAKEFFEEAVENLADYPQYKPEYLVGYARTLMHLNETNKAEKMLLSIVDDPNFVLFDAGSNAYFLLAQIERGKNNLDKAIRNAEEALKIEGFELDKVNVYNFLADVYVEKKEYANAMSAKDSVAMNIQRYNDKKVVRLFESNKVKFMLKNSELKNAEQQAKIRAQQNVMWVSIIAFVIFVVLLFCVLYYRRLQYRQLKVLNENKQRLLTLELEQEKNEQKFREKELKERESKTLLENEKLHREIEHKNRELSAKALFLSGRNELIGSVLSSLEKADENTASSINKTIKELKTILRSDDEWGSYIKHFEEINPEFIRTINQRHPSLNNNDLRFISYVYMNLSSKEIASIFNITPDAYRKRKERVLKKLNLDKEISLYSYLSSL